ncbi:MAG: tail fiber domain-containing protein [Xanthobacteraceae bacterium]
MSVRGWLFSSTFLTTLASSMVAVTAAFAGAAPPAELPAVDGINGTFSVQGGSDDTKGLFAGTGSLAVPLGGQYGAEFDGVAGGFDNRFLGGGAAHLFWRDPHRGLLGAYGDSIHWQTPIGGVNVGDVGGEGEAYLGQWTLRGVAGAEFGNNATNNAVSVVGIPGGFITTTTPNGILKHVTRFFDTVTLEYYVTDNWKASIGQRYLGGRNAAAFGTEYALASRGNMLPTLFAEARLGEGHDNYGAWAGLRLYFGNHDKTLIRRNREDDPSANLFDIVDTLGPGSTSTTGTCTNGETFLNGSCSGQPSDRRLKRDIVLLARLDNGVGIYRYLWSDIVYVGVMAQEVAQIVPAAVILGADGYCRVNYARLGLRMMTWDEWTAQRLPALAA